MFITSTTAAATIGGGAARGGGRVFEYYNIIIIIHFVKRKHFNFPRGPTVYIYIYNMCV